ncbi:MAG: Gfo/Idh/MocA family oxidoreductase [Clostridiaceae bacterium]|jgi:predicted dehydrogenase|nr:Gfo/Idh/MocA family oxidoreductase [Clostridiaceae bacterium]
MDHPVSVVLVGVGGYGRTYFEGIINNENEGKANIVGIVEPFIDKCLVVDEVKSRRIPVYDTLEEFYAKHKADYAVISTPIQFHCEQACYAMEMGSHVLCEKPMSATIQEAEKMIETKNRTGRMLAIGYQWSFSDEIQQLKQDIMDGMYGKPIRLKTLALWPRSINYFNRSWAGKKKDASGRWVLDSIANNATAHYLHNMLYVTGKTTQSSSIPATVEAELYRANNIENFDTVASRITTKDGIEMMFIASHAHGLHAGNLLEFSYEFSEGEIYYKDFQDLTIFEGRLKDGRVIKYDKPQVDSYLKLCCLIDQVQKGESIKCGSETSLPHTVCISGMQDSMPQIEVFPKEMVKKGTLPSGEDAIYVEGLADTLTDCYERWVLPNEIGVPWSKPGKKIDVSDYTCYLQCEEDR